MLGEQIRGEGGAVQVPRVAVLQDGVGERFGADARHVIGHGVVSPSLSALIVSHLIGFHRMANCLGPSRHL